MIKKTGGNEMAEKERVMVMDAEYRDDSMDAVVENILENTDLEFGGKTVLVKPNMAAQTKVEKAATTHPVLIKAVVKALKRRGAKKIMVGDNPGATAFGINEKCARVTGILDAAGGHYVNLMKHPRDVEINSEHLDHVNMSSEFFDCDYYINLPKLKGHAHAYMTGAVKNLYGMCVGGEKARLHVIGKNPRVFAEVLCDVFSSRTPDLHIMDAVIGMEGNGPTNGTPRDVGKIAASTNAFALDAVCAKMVKYNINRVKTLEVGKDRGLWSGDPDSIEVIGELPNIKRFKPPRTFGAYAIFGQIISPFNSCLPRIHEDKCIKCGLCAKQCPVDACTHVKGEYPQINKEECIKCYCCQEFCPADAISLDGMMFRLTNLLARTKRNIIM